jgi:hypothetical protein
MVVTREKPKYWEKNLPQLYFIHRSVIWIDFLYRTFKDSVNTSQKTRFVSMTKTSRLLHFGAFLPTYSVRCL